MVGGGGGKGFMDPPPIFREIHPPHWATAEAMVR